ncbi:MAG: hypothetical protein U0W40_07045 [Acidimicrobiia bacterium]
MTQPPVEPPTDAPPADAPKTHATADDAAPVEELDEHTRLLQEVRAKYGDAPRQGSLKKLQPGQGLALLAIIACAWTPFILWFFFGPAALVLGGLAYRQGEKRAKWIMLAAVLCMIAGIVMNNLPDKFVSN